MALLLRCWNRVLHGLSVGNVLLRLGSNEETNFAEFFSFFFVSLALYGDRSPGFVFTEFFLVLRYRIERCFMPSGVNSNRIVSSRFSGHLATFDLIFVAAFTGFYWVVLSLYGASRVFVFFLLESRSTFSLAVAGDQWRWLVSDWRSMGRPRRFRPISAAALAAIEISSTRCPLERLVDSKKQK